MTGLGRTLLALWLAIMLAQPAQAQTTRISANVPARLSVLKPLTLVGQQALEFGTVILSPGTWTGATVSLSATGVRSCSATVSCTGAATPARFQVSGTNNQTVVVTAPPVTLVNALDSSQRLTLTVQAPTTVALPNSGNPGTIFSVGGTVTLNSTTADGLYSGTLEITVDYQ